MGSIIQAQGPDEAEARAAEAQDSASSAVSWGAILAGATATTALIVILLLLGTGLGFGALSPWSHRAVDGSTLGVSMILWLLFTQVVAYGMGGYLAGRLRTKWLATQRDEVYFRDTAHGFLAWAVASLVCAALLTSVIAPIGGNGHDGARRGAGQWSSTAGRADHRSHGMRHHPSSEQVSRYYVDALLRPPVAVVGAPDTALHAATSTPPTATRAQRAEIERVFTHDLKQHQLAPQDLAYLGQRIALHTGMSIAAAEQRLQAGYEQLQASLRDARAAAQTHAEQARRAAGHAALWLFLSLLIGAFVASLAATYGGAQRDA